MASDETIITSIDNLDPEDEKKPFLTFIQGARLGQICELDKELMIVGRSPDCDFWIEDTSISRRHFKLHLEDNEVSLEDLGSTNGTYVNGKRIKKTVLHDGDKIQISRDSIMELTYLDQTRMLSEKKRYEMGVMDPVTNIYNKRYFLGRIQEEFSFSKRNQRDLSLVMLDLDHFKVLNDSYGHLAGDVVLQKVAAQVTQMIRPEDIFARYGGEEFVIIMRDAKSQNAKRLCERIREGIEKLVIPYEDQEIKVTVSMGFSTLTEKTKDYLELVTEADKHLYRSKRGGRNCISGPD